MAPSMDSELDKINQAKNQYRNSVRDLLVKFKDDLSSSEQEQLSLEMENLVKTVNTHKFSVLAKVNDLVPASHPMSEFEKASMNLQKKQLELQQKQLDLQLKAGDSRKDEAYALARPLKKLILEKCTQLDEELEQIPITHLSAGDDQQITRTMLKLSSWQQTLENIVSVNRELSEKTAIYPLPEAEQAEVSSAIETTKALFTNVKSTAEEEDLTRQLYSLDVSNRVEQVKWPTFAGEVGEDFAKFKADFLDASKQNKTSLRNQLTKLKENLKGYAKSLIPATVSDLDKAWKILQAACGDPMRLVNHRVENLMNVGSWPQEGLKDCFSKQVKWIIKVQGLIQEIIDLANSSEELGAVIYNRHQVSNILKLFPVFMIDKMAEIPGYKEEKYKQIIEKLDKYKNISLNRESILGTSQSRVSSSSPRTDKQPGNAS